MSSYEHVSRNLISFVLFRRFDRSLIGKFNTVFRRFDGSLIGKFNKDERQEQQDTKSSWYSPSVAIVLVVP